MYALIALGYTLVYGVLQLINFAHSEVFMTGAFGSYLVVNGIVGHRHLSGAMVPLTVVVGVLSGAICGAAIAWLLEKVAYRTLRRSGRAETGVPDQRDRRVAVPVEPGRQVVQPITEQPVPRPTSTSTTGCSRSAARRCR